MDASFLVKKIFHNKHFGETKQSEKCYSLGKCDTLGSCILGIYLLIIVGLGGSDIAYSMRH